MTHHHSLPARLPEMIFKISSLKDGGHRFCLSVDAVKFEDASLPPELFPNPIAVEVVLTKAGAEFFASLSFETVAMPECDLCLKPVARALTGEFRVLFSQDRSITPGRDDGEVRSLGKNATEIDLTEDLRETLLLSVPMKNTCEPPCEALHKKDAMSFEFRPNETNETLEASKWQEALRNIQNKN